MIRELIINCSEYFETFSFKVIYFNEYECNWYIHCTSKCKMCLYLHMFSSNYII